MQNSGQILHRTSIGEFLICESKLRTRLLVWYKISSALCIFLSNVQRLFLRALKSLGPLKPLKPPFCSFSRITALRCASFVIRWLPKAAKLQNEPYCARLLFVAQKGPM